MADLGKVSSIMGGFLTISGIAGVNLSDVEGELRTYATDNGGKFARDASGLSCPDWIVLTPGESARVSIMYPSACKNCDSLAKSLSKTLKSPVFLFHIHDGDFWMYWLFVNGKEVDQFNPIPDYWPGGCSARDRIRCVGKASVVAKHWPGVTPKVVKPYLVTWDLTDEDPRKAHADDLYSYNYCMQLVDFMRRLGLKFPLDDDEQPIGKFYRFEIP